MKLDRLLMLPEEARHARNMLSLTQRLRSIVTPAPSTILKTLVLFQQLIAYAMLLLSPSAFVYAGTSKPLPTTVTQALAQAGVPLSAATIIVQEVQTPPTNPPVMALNAQRAFNPASVMKLLTTYAALDRLGPAYTWQTTVLSTALPNQGTLDADLILKGGGDPHLTFEQFWLLLRQLRAMGIRDIRGDLVLDRTLFAPVDETLTDAAPAFDDQPLRPYNVPPDALLLNFKSIRLQLIGNAAQNSLSIFADPLPSNMELLNLIHLIQPDATDRSAEHPCDRWQENIHASLELVKNSYRLTLSGSYPLACGEKTWHLGVLPHPQYIYGVFSQLWHELGGTFHGRLRTDPPAVSPDKLYTLAHAESLSLAEIIRYINKYSNNVMARQLFLTLGLPDIDTHDVPSASRSAPATEAGASTYIRLWLKQKQLDFPELVLDNGSGLSRHERISASSLAQLLTLAWKSPLMPEFVASLPRVAVDGTMKNRLKHTGISGQAYIKTGTLEGVKTLAGYVLDRHGQWKIVVFMVNHPNAAATRPAQDALLQWVYEH